MPQINQNIIKLDNGLTLVLQPISNPNQKVNITFAFNEVGHATDTKPGIAHLSEHMVFRGNDQLGSKALADKLTYLSNGSYEAYTAYDKTVFSIDTYKNSLNEAVELLVEMFSKSTLNDFDTEKKVVKHELNMRLDNPYVNLFNLIDRGHGLKNDDSLQKENLPSLTKDDVKTFINDNYVPSKCQLIISGEMDDVDIVKAVVRSKTKGWQNSSTPKHQWKAIDYKPGYFSEAAPTKCSYFSLFFNGAKNDDNIKDIVNECIVNSVSGYGLNSIMMYDGRLNKGLTYNIQTVNVIEKDHGVWGVASFTDKESFAELLTSAMTSVKSIKYSISNPANNNVDIAKISLKNALNQPVLTPYGATSDYMFYSQFGVTKDEIIKIIDETTTNDVLNWFEKTLATGPSLALYGDIDPNQYSQQSVNEMWNMA